MNALLRYIAMAAAVMSTVAAAVAAPQIKWNGTRHDFGAFSEDLGTVSCTFRGVNVGDEDIMVFDVKSNCGCTTTDRLAGKRYAPGDTIEVGVTYNAVGRPGRFTKKVMVHSNATPERQELVISGTVMAASNTLKSRYPVDVGNFKAHSATAMLGEIYKGGMGGAYIKCYNHTSRPIKPRVLKTPKWLDVTVKPNVIQPGEMFVLSLNMATRDCPVWGIVTDTIRVCTATDGSDAVDFTAVTTIKEDFRRYTAEQHKLAPHIKVDPESIDLGTISRRDGAVHRTIKVSNSGSNPLMLRRIYSPDPALVVKPAVGKVNTGRSIDVTVSIDPLKVDGDLFNARVTIISNDPLQPTTIVNVIGQITD